MRNFFQDVERLVSYKRVFFSERIGRLFHSDTYRELTRIKFYNLDNTISNEFGSLQMGEWLTLLESDADKAIVKAILLLSGICFSEDKKRVDEVFETVKHTKTDLMNTRCYPTGWAVKGCTMIVGEAPSWKGTGIKEDYLKPTLFATDTSRFIRYVVYTFLHDPPYFTNLLKYAKPNNEVKPADLGENVPILLMELDLLQPSRVILLGNKVRDYLRGMLPPKIEARTVKIRHPSSCLYNNWTVEQYAQDVWEYL